MMYLVTAISVQNKLKSVSSCVPYCKFSCKIHAGISYQRSVLKPFLLYFFSEMCSGPGASSQIGIWERTTKWTHPSQTAEDRASPSPNYI